MPSTYTLPEDDMVQILRGLLDFHHRRLRDAGVTICLLVAYGAVDKNGDLQAPAITDRGYEALGLCKIMKLIDRVAGMADTRILVDGDRWETMTPEEQEALVDHELTHIEIVMDGAEPAKDGHDRPKLVIRRHDQHFGWFDEVAHRHGPSSQEVQQARKLADEVGQLYFDGMGLAPPPTKRRKRPARPDA